MRLILALTAITALTFGTALPVYANALSTTSLSVAGGPLTPGGTVTITALVDGDNPTGTVQFQVGTATIDAPLIAGTATADHTLEIAGWVTFTATYLGDANNLASTESLMLSVSRGSTSTNLTMSPSPATFGSPATLTANVSGYNPDGVVEFFRGFTSLGTAAIGGGTASLTITPDWIGSGIIIAEYHGSDNYSGSVGSLTVVVNPAPAATTTTITVTPNPSEIGSPIAITATVAGIDPTGTVTFRDGPDTLAVLSLGVDGTATLTYTPPTHGSRVITAEYSGDYLNAASSGTIDVIVELIPTTTSLDAPTSVLVGSAMTMVATVSPAATGTVDFYNGATLLGSATVDSGEAQFSYTLTAAGTLELSAQYRGDDTHAPSTSAVSVVTVMAPTPAEVLPTTGGETIPLAVLGALLLAAGVVLTRRRELSPRP